jgi:hypothetical protein
VHCVHTANEATGAGESGKSTVLKQMRIINAGGFGKPERKTWRATIFNNLVSAFQTIYAAMQEDDTDFEDEDNIVRAATRRPVPGHPQLTPHSGTRSSSIRRRTSAPTSPCLKSSSRPSTVCGPTRACS